MCRSLHLRRHVHFVTLLATDRSDSVSGSWSIPDQGSEDQPPSSSTDRVPPSNSRSSSIGLGSLVAAAAASSEAAGGTSDEHSSPGDTLPCPRVEATMTRDVLSRKLHDEHADRQGAHTTSLCHSAELHRRLNTAEASAHSFVRFCQDRHAKLIQEANSLLVSPASESDSDTAVRDREAAGQDRDAVVADFHPTLQPTVVPRRLWIPGFHRERLFRASDVTPWDVDLVSYLHVAQIDLRVLNTLLVNVSEWLFPEIDPESHPSPRTYEPLITGATVNALMDTSSPPWADLNNNEAPLTFIPHLFGRPLSPDFAQAYLELEERHLQSYWESTHFLSISDTMSEADPILAAYHEQQRQRRSRAGAAWRKFLLKHVIPALRKRQSRRTVATPVPVEPAGSSGYENRPSP
ncbi:hypothetical protein ON010_g17595 [Phytophthora cinnamomi]|nr:hypothetical protein ON010_g17595 [Phytophthora cinnamomi]